MTKHGDEWQTVAESVYGTLSNGLEELAWMNVPVHDDLELALLSLTSMEVRLTAGVFETWLKAWHAHQVVLDGRAFDLTQNLNICFEEKTLSMTRNLLKKDRQEMTPLNLGQVVAPVCVKNDGFRIAANRIQKRVVGPMGELMVWKVDCEMRDVQGQSQPREWRIGVGPALLWFQKLVYVPLRRRQVQDFVRKHGDLLG